MKSMLISPPLAAKPRDTPGSPDLALPGPLMSPRSSEDEDTARDLDASKTKPRRRHSEIERRRRAKMNEKFEELRELIPACRAFQFAKRGGDAGIHKLDILSSAVGHIRHLEQQLADERAKAARQASPTDKSRIAFLMN